MKTRDLARIATQVENGASLPAGLAEGAGIIAGITGPPGAGKSTLVDALIAELRSRNKTVAAICVDPTSRISGGAILGDRVRMQRHYADAGVYIRSMASRGAAGGIARTTAAMARLFRSVGFDLTLIETLGVGQDEVEIAGHVDRTLVVLAPGMGDEIQAIKAGVMEIADAFVINKCDRGGADATERELETMHPVFRTVASEGNGIAAVADYLCETPAGRVGDTATVSVDHIAVAVQSIDAALGFYEALGLQINHRETVAHEKVSVAMLPVGEIRLELLQAAESDSTVAKFLEKRGPGLHHVALKVSDLENLAARLRASGARLLGEVKTGAGGHRYVFVHPQSTGGVLWELIQA